jgi:N-acetyl-anhydromuramyl-L-alanine amidase AmpD
MIDTQPTASSSPRGITPWLTGWPRLVSPHPGRQLAAPPRLIVLHSGDKRASVAEYLLAPDAPVSAHFAWSTGAGGLVQMVPLDREAMHAGCGTAVKCSYHRRGECMGGRYDGQRINAISWGIELPGPWDQQRDESQHRQLMALLSELTMRAPIEVIAAHSALCKNRRDPGPGLDWDRLSVYGAKLLR